jgi:hypothetical protein
MQDACTIGALTQGVDSAGGPTSTYTYGSEIACGVNTHPGRGAQGRFYDSDGTYWVADAEIRLPLGTAIAFSSRVRVTKRMGTAVTNVDYDLLRVPAVGVSCIVLYCRAVST